MESVAGKINSVCIAGAGSIGSLYAGHLASIANVQVLCRRSQHAESLNREGLRVSGKTHRHVRVRASTVPEDLDYADLIILATKAFDVEQCAKEMAGYSPNALFMLVQNGLGCEEIAARYGEWRIISAVTFMAGTRHTDIHVEYELDTATWLAPWMGGNAVFEDARSIADLLEKSGLVAKAFMDLLPAEWSKLIFNSVINSVCAATDLPFTKPFIQRQSISDLGHLVFDMISEGKSVADSLHISLYQDPWEMVLEVAERASKEAGDGRMPSMLADVRARRRTEIDWITGVIVKEAIKLNLPVPIHETLYRLIKAREADWL